MLTHPLASPAQPGHTQFILSLIHGLFQAEAPIVLKLVPNPAVQVGIVAGEVALEAVEAALGIAPAPAAPAAQ